MRKQITRWRAISWLGCSTILVVPPHSYSRRTSWVALLLSQCLSPDKLHRWFTTV